MNKRRMLNSPLSNSEGVGNSPDVRSGEIHKSILAMAAALCITVFGLCNGLDHFSEKPMPASVKNLLSRAAHRNGCSLREIKDERNAYRIVFDDKAHGTSEIIGHAELVRDHEGKTGVRFWPSHTISRKEGDGSITDGFLVSGDSVEIFEATIRMLRSKTGRKNK